MALCNYFYWIKLWLLYCICLGKIKRESDWCTPVCLLKPFTWNSDITKLCLFPNWKKISFHRTMNICHLHHYLPTTLERPQILQEFNPDSDLFGNGKFHIWQKYKHGLIVSIWNCSFRLHALPKREFSPQPHFKSKCDCGKLYKLSKSCRL